MAETYDGFEAGETVGGVFDRLYGQANTLALELEGLVRASGVPFGRNVPDTPLEVDPGAGLAEDNQVREYRFVSAKQGYTHRNLLYLLEHGQLTEEEADAHPLYVLRKDVDVAMRPAAIGGFRDNTDAWFLSDYELAQHASGVITCTIQPLLLENEKTQEREAVPDELDGVTRHDADIEVGALDELERKRLGVIRTAITLGIARAEILRDGNATFGKLFGVPEPLRPQKRRRLRLPFLANMFEYWPGY